MGMEILVLLEPGAKRLLWPEIELVGSISHGDTLF